MGPFDAVLFDAGETLVHPDPSFGELLVDLLGRRGIECRPDDGIERVLASALAALAERGEPFSTSPDISRRFWTGLYASVLGELGVADPAGETSAYLYSEFSRPENYALYPDALPALRKLRERGYRLGIVSNFESWLDDLLARLGVTPLMDVVVISGAEGVEKPDPRIFHAALNRLRLAPERVLYVGDNPRIDLESARAVGMAALLVDRRGRNPDSAAVQSLEQIPELLAS